MQDEQVGTWRTVIVTNGDEKNKGTNLLEVQQKTARVTTEPNPYRSPYKLESLDKSHSVATKEL